MTTEEFNDLIYDKPLDDLLEIFEDLMASTLITLYNKAELIASPDSNPIISSRYTNQLVELNYNTTTLRNYIQEVYGKYYFIIYPQYLSFTLSNKLNSLREYLTLIYEKQIDLPPFESIREYEWRQRIYTRYANLITSVIEETFGVQSMPITHSTVYDSLLEKRRKNEEAIKNRTVIRSDMERAVKESLKSMHEKDVEDVDKFISDNKFDANLLATFTVDVNKHKDFFNDLDFENVT